MALISFKCPACGNLFSKRFDHIPEACTLIDKCPICHKTVNLTPENTTEAPAVQIIELNTRKKY